MALSDRSHNKHPATNDQNIQIFKAMSIKIKPFVLIWLIPLLLLAEPDTNCMNRSDTLSFQVERIKIYPCRKGKNTVDLTVTNTSQEPLIFALHIQSNIRISASVGRGWGTVFYDTIPSGQEELVSHSFLFHSEVADGISLRLQFYQLKASESWNFNEYFYRKTFDPFEISALCTEFTSLPQISDVEIQKEFQRIRNHAENNQPKDLWNCFTRSYQEAQYQGDFIGFMNELNASPPIDHWNADQLLSLVPTEFLIQDDGRVLLNLLLDKDPWMIYFKYADSQWKIDWIDGFTTLVDLWMSWPERLLPKMQTISTEHFDFYFDRGSYAEKNMEHIIQVREEGYKRICEFLQLDTDQRICTVFFNDLATKAFETGHRGKGAAFDTTIIEVYNEEIQAHPFHETVHILSNPLGFPPALFFEGLAEYLEIALAGENSLELFIELENQILSLKGAKDWIPIKDLIKYTDIPGPSPAHVSYPEAAAFVKYLLETYGLQKFKECYSGLVNSDIEQLKNMDSLEAIYGKSLDILIDEFNANYL